MRLSREKNRVTIGNTCMSNIHSAKKVYLTIKLVQESVLNNKIKICKISNYANKADWHTSHIFKAYCE